jgi:hypothetical protein
VRARCYRAVSGFEKPVVAGGYCGDVAAVFFKIWAIISGISLVLALAVSVLNDASRPSPAPGENPGVGSGLDTLAIWFAFLLVRFIIGPVIALVVAFARRSPKTGS